MKQKTVLTFGTFDVLHEGHLSYLEQARKLGDRLVVIIGRDKNVKKSKGMLPIMNEKHRLRIIQALKPVDEAILGQDKDFFQSVINVKPDVIALGYDQKMLESHLIQALAERNFSAKIVRLKPFKEKQHKSTIIKEKIRKMKKT
ncbi:MAG: adenylyltransferase/cytidyltransferase family protein [archaeon]|nr:adenylyltransferase/cytidyltransferase family protein [archaeon]